MATGRTLVPSNDIYRDGWSEWVFSKTEKGILLTDHNQNLTNTYWDCKRAFTEGWQEGLRCIDANEQD